MFVKDQDPKSRRKLWPSVVDKHHLATKLKSVQVIFKDAWNLLTSAKERVFQTTFSAEIHEKFNLGLEG